MCSVTAEPDFLPLLRGAIQENFPDLEWKDTWNVALVGFYEAEVKNGTDPEVFMDVATALGGYPKQYINYSMTVQNWVRREKKRQAERASNFNVPGQRTNITPISEDARKQWNG